MRIGGRWESGVRPIRVGGVALGVLLFALPVVSREAGPGTGGAPPIGNLTGQFLVASQQLTDPNFAKTVIYMLVAPADPSLIFSTKPEEIWVKALMHAGISL